MDEAVAQFLSTGTVVLAGVCIVGSFFIRRIVETAVPSVRQTADENSPKTSYPNALSRWWNQVILYSIPVIVGCLVGLIQVEFIFGSQINTLSGRVFYGMVVGFFSGFLYKIFRRALASKAGIELPSTPPLPPG